MIWKNNINKCVIYSLPQAPFAKWNVKKTWKLLKYHENYLKNVIYSLPQAPFWQKNNEKYMNKHENMNMIETSWKPS